MIQEERISVLKGGDVRRGRYVLYWMQQSQRVDYNHALEYAVDEANRLKKPVVVYFGITADYPHANARHYRFMLEGLKETKAALAKRGIQMVVRCESPEIGVRKMAMGACLAVTDRGYARLQRKWRDVAAHVMPCRLVQVESDVIVPVEVCSNKEEYSAATIRPKIHRLSERFLIPLIKKRVRHKSTSMKFPFFDILDIDRALEILKVDARVGPAALTGGAKEAKKLLRRFIKYHIEDYDEKRNDPNRDAQSGLSPYLHFGQISPLHIAREVIRSRATRTAKQAFLEELIVRRELAINFVFYNKHYDSFDCLPKWCADTLHKHRRDKRPYRYTRAQLERAETHDSYWNAAQREMMIAGKMHGYLRMYWGKKIIEWTKKPRDAYATAIYLNDTYELDGRDPNGYAGVAWCFGKHDRPWGERDVFGTVRYMNDTGLKRKFDADAYVERVDAMVPS